MFGRRRSYLGLTDEDAVLLERSRSGWRLLSRLPHGPSLVLELARSAGRRDPPLLKVGRDIWEYPRRFEAEAIETFQARGLVVHAPID